MMDEHQKFLAAASACYIAVVGLFLVLVAERWLTAEQLHIFRRSSFPLTFAIALAYELVLKPDNWRTVFKSLLPLIAGIFLLVVTR